MGRQPCCDKVGLKRGPWSAEEDMKLVSFITRHGHECWRQVPKLCGLLRCGKSCRLRWTNYLRPGVKRGQLSDAEEKLIIDLHAAIGNRWSRIAAQLPGRTDNEIKNYWNTRIKKKLRRMGIDPATHRPLVSESEEERGGGGKKKEAGAEEAEKAAYISSSSNNFGDHRCDHRCDRDRDHHRDHHRDHDEACEGFAGAASRAAIPAESTKQQLWKKERMEKESREAHMRVEKMRAALRAFNNSSGGSLSGSISTAAIVRGRHVAGIGRAHLAGAGDDKRGCLSAARAGNDNGTDNDHHNIDKRGCLSAAHSANDNDNHNDKAGGSDNDNRNDKRGRLSAGRARNDNGNGDHNDERGCLSAGRAGNDDDNRIGNDKRGCLSAGGAGNDNGNHIGNDKRGCLSARPDREYGLYAADELPGSSSSTTPHYCTATASPAFGFGFGFDLIPDDRSGDEHDLSCYDPALHAAMQQLRGQAESISSSSSCCWGSIMRMPPPNPSCCFCWDGPCVCIWANPSIPDPDECSSRPCVPDAGLGF